MTDLTANQEDHFFDLACGGKRGLNLSGLCCGKHTDLTPYQRGIAHGHDESDIATYYYERAAGYPLGDADAFGDRLGQDDGGHNGAGPFFVDQEAVIFPALAEDNAVDGYSANEIHTESDAIEWLRQVAEHNNFFHLDDEADDIWPGEFGEQMEQRRQEVLAIGDPWELIEMNDTLRELWEPLA